MGWLGSLLGTLGGTLGGLIPIPGVGSLLGGLGAGAGNAIEGAPDQPKQPIQIAQAGGKPVQQPEESPRLAALRSMLMQ